MEMAQRTTRFGERSLCTAVDAKVLLQVSSRKDAQARSWECS